MVPWLRQAGEVRVGAEALPAMWLRRACPAAHAAAMFAVSEADADAIRAVFDREGEFAAAIELRRRFPGVEDNREARECARVIAGWKPLPATLRRRRLRGEKATESPQ